MNTYDAWGEEARRMRRNYVNYVRVQGLAMADEENHYCDEHMAY